jgi:hypothetical protein
VSREYFADDSFPTAPLAVAAMARRQKGLIRASQLRALGFDTARIARWVKAGRLHRIYRGVYAVGHAALSREARFLAAVFAAGRDAALSHLAAAEHYEIRRYPVSVIDVVAPRKRIAPSGTRFHQARRLDPRDVTVHKGIPITTIPRLAVDLSDALSDDDLANVLHEADYRGWLHLANVRTALARANGRHNLDVLERALALLEQGSAGSKSRAERALRARLGPEWLPNVTVEGFEVDLHVPGTKVIVEIDGPGHRRERTKRDDALRDEVLDAAGYEVIRLPATRQGRR